VVNELYTAVIPKWVSSLIKNEPVYTVYINGDGSTSCDFCYIDNTIQANLLAATSENSDAANQVYNVAVGERTSLNELYIHLRAALAQQFPHLKDALPVYRDFRAGDVRHSLADITKAHQLLGYLPSHRIGEGLKEALSWYIQHLTR
jgi:UDP-N-acetylglucosamine 4-epimerase